MEQKNSLITYLNDSGKIIQTYKNALAGYAILISFIPMFMDIGGNAWGQASAIVIRTLLLHEIYFIF